MKEFYYEESAVPLNAAGQEKLYKVFKIISIVLFILGALVFMPGLSRIYAYFFYDGLTEEELTSCLLGFIACVLFGCFFVALGLGFTFANKRINIVYDYEFVSGEIRIKKVHGNNKKPVCVITPPEIRQIGRYNSNGYFRLKNNNSNKEIRFTPNKTAAEGKDFYYFYVSSSTGGRLLILECRKELISYVSQYVNKSALEEGL